MLSAFLLNMPAPPSFAQRIILWQRRHGRHHLPWQNTRDPYRIWLSEIMLQQTQVETVKSYYLRFLSVFPNVFALARAPVTQVLELWSGLGYYRRAHFLHHTARRIIDDYHGTFPETEQELTELPGIGRSTAAAIAVFAFHRHAAILDGNVKRILARHHGIEGDPTQSSVEKHMWAVAETLLPKNNLPAYTQGLMDLGAQICTRTCPDCPHCPLRQDCFAHAAQQTALLPSPRQRQTIPEIPFQLLVIRHQDRILLEERRTQKIWSGLWSFPECAMGEDATQTVQQRFGLKACDHVVHTPVRHRLTHRLLIMTPVELHVAHERLRQTNHCRFYRHEEALSCAMPTPIRRILAKI